MSSKEWKDEVDVHENMKIAKLNSDIKRSALFSHYIWTHDIHSLEKIRKPHWLDDEKNKDLKLIASKSQGALEKVYNLSEVKELEEEEEKNKKVTQKKNTSTEKLAGYLEKVDSLSTSRKPQSVISEKIEDLVQEVSGKRMRNISKYQEMYNELFGNKQDLMPTTSKKNQEFIERIRDLQQELRPELQKLPLIFDNNIKQGAKSKPTKISIEPSLMSSTRMKIQQLREIEMKQKLKTSRQNLSKVPFTLHKSKE